MPHNTTPTTSALARSFTVRMSPRDLINIGMFAALYLVIVFAINMLGFINPAVMLVALAASMVAGGIPFMLFLTRVKHAGMITIFGVIVSGLLLLTGHPPISFALTVALSLVAEVIVWAGRYRSRIASVVAYTVYTVCFVGPMLPLFYAREDCFASAGMQQMGQTYIDQMDRLLSPAVLIGYDVSTLVFGFLGALLGLRLMSKHFTRAGLA